jgi:hypothetical protein
MKNGRLKKDDRFHLIMLISDFAKLPVSGTKFLVQQLMDELKRKCCCKRGLLCGHKEKSMS